ncbi:D-isomer specific 2-hydroxyacid dehydrogenase [Aspergillus germanicus]
MIMQATKPLVLFFNPVKFARPFYEQLQKVALTEVVTSRSREEFFQDLQDKYKDVFAIYRTSSSGAIAGKFDADFIKELPSSCKYICHNGAGYDPIDTDACAKRGIIVTNAPDPVTDATADLAVFLLLGALRQLNPAMTSLRAGTFKTGVNVGNDPQDKVLGILGMGRIGRAIKKRCDAFGLRTVYYNRSQLAPEQAAGAEYVSFEKLLAESDIISVNVPLTAKTKHLIGAPELARMKPGVVIVNTARGAIIDEAALANALQSGHVGAAGLDVYEKEPEINEKLLRQERAIMVPHVGTHTAETLGKMETWAMENVRRAIVGEPLLSPVPEHQGLALEARSAI